MNPTAMEFLSEVDAASVGRLLDRWRPGRPEMGVLALLPEAEKASLGDLQRACAEAGVPLAGGVFPALIRDNGFRAGGVWLLRFDRMPHVALYADLPRGEGLEEAVEGIVADLTPHLAAGDQTLLLLFDAMVPNIGTVLDALYLQLADRVHYMGANAGSETFQPMPCLFDGERVIENGVLAMLLDAHRGAILEHGYEVPDRMIAATSTEGNRILQIDWRPAFEVYRELARAQYGVEINRDNFYQYGVHFPFGIVRANGITVVRIPVALQDDGSLFCVGEVPANAMLALLRAPAVDSRHTIDTLVQGLADLNGAVDGEDLLLFYCAGRRLHLGVDAAAAEVRALGESSHAGCLAGALSLGEIGSTTQWGYPLFHNATLVASLWNRQPQ